MTGREALEVAMEQLGATKQQIQSKTVDIVLSALSREDIDTKVLFRETYDAEMKELIALQRAANQEMTQYYNQRADYLHAERQLKEKESKLRMEIGEEVRRREEKVSQREAEVARKEELYKNIEVCETSEAKDKLRLAEYYKKSVAECKDDKNYITRLMAGLSNILGATRTEQIKANIED